MRIRVLGHDVPLSIAILVLVDGTVAFLSTYAAARIHGLKGPWLHLHYPLGLGALSLRAAMFALLVVLSLWACGLYSARQRAQFPGVLAPLGAALMGANCAFVAVFYLVPTLELSLDFQMLAGLVTGIGLVTSRLVFSVSRTKPHNLEETDGMKVNPWAYGFLGPVTLAGLIVIWGDHIGGRVVEVAVIVAFLSALSCLAAYVVSKAPPRKWS